MKLWIDDVRTPPDNDSDWVWVKTSKNAIEIIDKITSITEISFDHDLGGDDTTIPVVNHLEQLAYHIQITPCVMKIHSQNPVGRKNLQIAIDKIQSLFDVYDSCM